MSPAADTSKRTNSASTVAHRGQPDVTDAPPPPDADHTHQNEDMEIAERAEKEYNLRGIRDTTPYTEYRDRRLGSKS